ncbi:FAD-binding protein [Cohnella fermenti]|uniref:FAD-binding protein n=1 Tax=Cohnella fermenti TaxID=2565925 RepID=A0A4S4BF46_9BACL|nr:FAD-binding protein [Cohnella fermenti]
MVGAGVAGIYAALELAGQGRRTLVIDKGKKLEERRCPQEGEGSCDCEACDKYVGFGGLGLSEGKYNYTNDFGGDLERKVGSERALALMDEVDAVLCAHGADRVGIYDTSDPELSARARAAGFDTLATRTRHLGTELSRAVLGGIYGELENRIAWRFRTEVRELRPLEGGGFELTLSDGEELEADTVLIATGRSGNEWLSRQCAALGLGRGEARLDLGLRIEMRGDQLDTLLGRAFETKLRFSADGYSATTYCMNPRGRVVLKLQEGLAMPDGQNARERGDGGTGNLNFTLFVPAFFSTLDEADRRLHEVVGGINRGRNRIAAQRLADLRAGLAEEDGEFAGEGREFAREGREFAREGREFAGEGGAGLATTVAAAARTIQPTLAAEPADLRKEVPELYVRAALEFLEALEKLIGEPIDDDTIVYAIDAKLYSPGIATDERFETSVPGLYVIGDCSGTTHSLSQAAASGLHVGRLLGSR